MALNFRKFFEGLKIIPKTSSTADSAGEMDVTSGNGKLNYHNGTTPSPVVTESHTATLINKTIDGDDNTVQDLALTSLKTVLADANKVIQRDAAGVVISGPIIPAGSGDIVRTDSTQTLTNKTIDGDDNTLQDISLPSLKTVLADANKVLERDASGIVVSGQIKANSAYVGISDNQVLTNKTIDGDDNTVQNLALTSLKTDAGNANKFIQRDGAGIVVNGPAVPTGPVVGTTDTQTLSNKSLIDASTFIIDDGDPTKKAQFQVSSISTATTRTFTLPDANTTVVGTDTTQTLTNKTLTAPIMNSQQISDFADFTDQSSTPASPSAGHHKFYPKTDGKFYSLNSSGTEVPIGSGGSGGGGVNLGILANKNIDAESSTADWSTYNDGGASYIDGTGGVVTGVTFARTTTVGEVLNGVGSFKLSKDAANRQGMGVSIDTPVPLGYRGQPGKLNFPVKLSANYIAGDVSMYLYDVTNGRVIQPTMPQINISGGSQDLFQGFFYIPIDCATIRASFFIASTSALAYDVIFDDFGILAIEGLEAGPSITDPFAYAPTFNGLGVPTGVEVYAYQVGKTGVIYGKWTAGTSTAAQARMSLPSGWIIDTDPTLVPSTKIVGFGGYSTVVATVGTVLADAGLNYLKFGAQDAGNAGLTPLNGNVMINAGTTISFFATVPILGFTSGSKTIIDLPTKKVIADVSRSAIQTIPDSTFTVLVFDTIAEDSDGRFNTSTGQYNCKYPGDYDVRSNILFDTNTTGYRTLDVYRNGSFYKRLDQKTGVTGIGTMVGGSITVTNCAVGDLLTVVVFQSSGGNLDTNAGSPFNFATFTRVNDRTQIVPTTECAIIARLSVNTAFGANAPIIFDDVIQDKTGSYNPATGVMTCKIPGLYWVEPVLQGTTFSGDGLYVLSTSRAAFFGSFQSSGEISGGGMLVPMEIGDTLSIRDTQANTFTGIAGGTDVSHVSIYKVGT